MHFSNQSFSAFVAFALASNLFVDASDQGLRHLNPANPDVVAEIVGGQDAALGDYPYYAQLGGCGGTLIDPRVILTAAHCDDPASVYVGNIEPYSVEEGGIYIPDGCAEFIRSADYDSSTFDMDFALCLLAEPVNIDDNEVVLELNFDGGVPVDGETLRAIGLGALSSGGSFPDTLQWVDVPYVSNSVCDADSYPGDITDNMLCAGLPEGGVDSCQGDSGGPLVIVTANEGGADVHTHVGVVSWGAGCAWAGYYGVYARTSRAQAFIVDTVCNSDPGWGIEASFCTPTSTPPPTPTSTPPPTPASTPPPTPTSTPPPTTKSGKGTGTKPPKSTKSPKRH